MDGDGKNQRASTRLITLSWPEMVAVQELVPARPALASIHETSVAMPAAFAALLPLPNHSRWARATSAATMSAVSFESSADVTGTTAHGRRGAPAGRVLRSTCGACGAPGPQSGPWQCEARPGASPASRPGTILRRIGRRPPPALRRRGGWKSRRLGCAPPGPYLCAPGGHGGRGWGLRWCGEAGVWEAAPRASHAEIAATPCPAGLSASTPPPPRVPRVPRPATGHFGLDQAEPPPRASPVGSVARLGTALGGRGRPGFRRAPAARAVWIACREKRWGWATAGDFSMEVMVNQAGFTGGRKCDTGGRKSLSVYVTFTSVT